MEPLISRFFFDQQDHELLAIVNKVLDRQRQRKDLKDLFEPYLHPNGIKETAAAKEIRIAYAVIHLFDMLKTGRLDERLRALRAARDEVLHCAQSNLPYNTGRVLLQTMKELLRAHGDYRRQLELAHDFRLASGGKPRMVRKLLRRQHLAEMPEDWNQVCFDNHVHDANTKGRKSPTHLITDAWIKGVRELTVIYYNYIRPEAAAELLEAAGTMGLRARIGIEFTCSLRGRQVPLIWVPQGFAGTQGFLNFLAEPGVQDFLAEGRKVSLHQENNVFKVLENFNRVHRPSLEKEYQIHLPELSKEDFTAFVGPGQASILHLGAFIHAQLLPLLRARVSELRREHEKADPAGRKALEESFGKLNQLDSETLVDLYLRPQMNPEPNPAGAGAEPPSLLSLSPAELITRLGHLNPAMRVTLNLSGLQVEDVIEVLYDCDGLISHLEIFNLKDHVAGKTAHIKEIDEFQKALNQGNVFGLKKCLRQAMARLEASQEPGADEQAEKLRRILEDIGTLRDYYRGGRLNLLMGSDSTGRSARSPGMGLVVRESLPRRAVRAVEKARSSSHQVLPVQAGVAKRLTFRPRQGLTGLSDRLFGLLRRLPPLARLGYKTEADWISEVRSTRLAEPGNVISLGGTHRGMDNGLCLVPEEPGPNPSIPSPAYLNTGLKNGLKVLAGFLPAFLTFALTKDWWLLAYGGAMIWFAITGLRNILQSVLGGGGIRRSPLLTWSNCVSWDRIADSLLFTGFSVPLLDYLVKTVILDRGLDITTATHPAALYACIALANGLYISSHNAFRGLPRGAVLGNLFRTVLSIPLAVVFNDVLGAGLTAYGAADVFGILEKWAAVISKAASDCVAGVIEGLADRRKNIVMRCRDYEGKLGQFFDAFARLELLFPTAQVREMLSSPKAFIRTLGAEARDLEKVIIINALDLLYFWMYQPRARIVFANLLKGLSPEEREVLLTSQNVLLRYREISQMFVNGLVGKRFSTALAFYLDNHKPYLEALSRLKAG